MRGVTLNNRLLLAAVPVTLAVVAAGCGGSHSPSVASLGPTTATTTTSSAPAAQSSGSPAGRKPSAAAFVAFVHCLQKHGIQAQLSAQGGGVSISGGDPKSPQFQAAQKACHTLLPGGGPPTLSPAQKAEQLKQLLALAKCVRAHGYPNFPDPDSQGSFDLQSAGSFDPKTPQFQSAMKACRPSGTPLRVGFRVGR
jgi:hypothetical protein